MLLTLLSLLALAAAFAYLLWSIGAQYPDTSMQAADRPDQEERLARRGSPLSTQVRSRRGRRRPTRASRPDPGDPGLPTRVSVDRGLAEVMIAEAAAARAEPKKVARAERLLVRGDGFAAAGHFEKALQQYGKAWLTASEALDTTR
jgi:hypothetical protein